MTSALSRLGGSIVAIVTPFRDTELVTRATQATREDLARVLPGIMLAEQRAGARPRYALAS